MQIEHLPKLVGNLCALILVLLIAFLLITRKELLNSKSQSLTKATLDKGLLGSFETSSPIIALSLVALLFVYGSNFVLPKFVLVQVDNLPAIRRPVNVNLSSPGSEKTVLKPFSADEIRRGIVSLGEVDFGEPPASAQPRGGVVVR